MEGPLTTVVFALVAAVAFGTADFGGGVLSRRTAAFGVVLISQLVGLAGALGVAGLSGEPVPSSVDIGLSVIAGLFGGVAIAALYRGLAEGRMAVVAPITAVLASVIPVVGGVLLQGLPPPVVSFGIGLALISVVLVSRVAGDGAAGREGMGLAMISGTAFGGFEIVVSMISDGAVLWPLTVIRVSQVAVVALAIILTRTAWRPPRGLLPSIAAIGILDIVATGAFVLAVQAGSLAVASVVSSLYPVVTIVLAAVLLRERVTRPHGVAIGLATAAIVLIGGDAL